MDSIQCPNCGSRRTCWTQDRTNLRWVIVCLDCGHTFAPPPRAQIARTVADIQRAIEGKRWHEER